MLGKASVLCVQVRQLSMQRCDADRRVVVCRCRRFLLCGNDSGVQLWVPVNEWAVHARGSRDSDMLEVDDARNCVLGSAEPLREPFDRVLDRSLLVRRRAAVGLRAAGCSYLVD